MDKNPHILIVDDDNRILKLLKKFLNQNGFLVSSCSNANEAMDLLSNFIFDLMILDVMMPNITGIEFAKKIKDSGAIMPIVMLTALSEPEDKIKGLEAGANDYITKPFDPRELLLRINNLINTHKKYKKEQEIIKFGNNAYNLVTKVFQQNDLDINLSSAEINLLETFIKAENNVISREDLSEKLGGLNLRSIDVQIVRLRNKIEKDPKNPQFLKTIRNKGYAFYT
ncbi:MAG: response regulator transcription factor [Rickettsiales bacterium]|nr:MAG: response regulator transcription factor [Rickettsiales bacterium]